MKRELVDNVWAFLDRAADLYAKMESDGFSQRMHTNCLERGMQSPIEDMFWIACATMCKAASIEFNPEPEFSKDGVMVDGCGIFVYPQRKVGDYRVDFLLSQNGIGPDEFLKPIVVELDGHEFHDKDKRQRSYEKARDRFLVKEGYRVLHFTGSDVVADPFKVAYEALDMLGLSACIGLDAYDPKDPLGLGY